jgi:hypothetical protein
MKTRFLIVALVLLMGCPSVSHGFGIFRYVFDGISNQLGLDRGAVPKFPTKATTPVVDAKGQPLPKMPDPNLKYMQADGF